jgi:predicted RNA-binding protein YlqC (UPF0109 family)
MPSGPGIDYRALVEFVAKSLAEKPDDVTVEAFERGGGTVAIKVKLADEDVGRFIGKAGRNIEAIRTCATASAYSSTWPTRRSRASRLPRGAGGPAAR